jgi:hypothetical protein
MPGEHRLVERRWSRKKAQKTQKPDLVLHQENEGFVAVGGCINGFDQVGGGWYCRRVNLKLDLLLSGALLLSCAAVGF